MVETLKQTGYEGKVGFQVDIAAGTYYDKAKERYVGLFSAEDKTRDDLMRLYEETVKNYPFVIIEDPLDENDYEGHAILTRELGVAIVGDDLFTTNTERLQHGLALGAANTMLLKVNQIGTISEAFDAVQMCYDHGYGVMPCDSRGEGPNMRRSRRRPQHRSPARRRHRSVGNRFLEIEAELGSRSPVRRTQGIQAVGSGRDCRRAYHSAPARRRFRPRTSRSGGGRC